MQSEPLFRRDRTAELIVLRRAALRQAQWLAQQQQQQQQQEEPGSGGGGGGASASASPLKPPPWVRVLEHFEELHETVSKRMEQLHSAQLDFFSPKFVATDEEEQQKGEMQEAQHGIQRLIKELERMVLSGIRPADPDNVDEAVAAGNVQKLLTHRLTALITRFKDTQEWFAGQMRRREEKVRRFNKLGSAETHEKLEREEKIAGYLELGYTQADISELLAMDQQAQETSREVQDILASIQEIHSMFADLKGIVDEQGTVIDRIDYNVEQAHRKITGGLDELRKARVEQKKCAVA